MRHAALTKSLRYAFRARGEINLVDAEIGGSLQCEGGTFNNPQGRALNADHLRTGGNVVLSRSPNEGQVSQFEGQVDLVAADIGGIVEGRSGTFHSPPHEYALDAGRIRVGGEVLFTGATVKGGIDLLKADIKGSLQCDATTIESDTIAIYAENITIGANVLLGNLPDSPRKSPAPFKVKGILDLFGADIEGTLLLASRNISTDSSVDLRNVTAARYGDDDRNWPHKGQLVLDGFVYHRLMGARDARKRISWIQLQGKDNFSPQPYEQLAKVLRDAGDDSGARVVLIALENERFRREPNPLVRFKSWIIWVTIGYGYEPDRAVLWLAALVYIVGLYSIGVFGGTG